MSNFTRRSFLKLSGAAAALGTVGLATSNVAIAGASKKVVVV